MGYEISERSPVWQLFYRLRMNHDSFVVIRRERFHTTEERFYFSFNIERFYSSFNIATNSCDVIQQKTVTVIQEITFVFESYASFYEYLNP